MRIFLAALIFTSITANALVDMQNANFTENWIDLEFPDTGYSLKVERAYNSRTLHNGLFGFGWCSNFETQLEILADGRIKRVECGAGQEIIFSPKSFNAKDVAESISNITAAIKKEKPTITDRELKALASKLRQDSFYRDQEANRLGIRVELKEGTTFYNESNNTDKIVFKKNMYTRDNPDGSSEKYNTKGKIAFLYDKNQNFLKFEYNKDTLSTLSTSSGKRLSFSYTANGKIKEIRGPNNITAEYRYEKLNDLAFAKNGKNESYQYSYDALHNLTSITYPDKTVKKLKYNEDKDWVTELTDRNGCSEKYSYELSKEDPKNHYWSTVTKTCDKKVVNKSKYGFWFKPRKVGAGVFLARLSIDANGAKSDIEYHEIFEKPISIRNAKETIKYDYYPNGLLKSKNTNGLVIGFKYNNQGKVSEVKEGKTVTQFEYDKFGNLTEAVNSGGQKVQLSYDKKGRIVKIFDQAKRLINIEYDERFGKPKTVERPGVGKIFVSYNSNGEVAKVESKNGDPTVAVQVASAFNNLVDIISPAGINIGL